MDYKSDIKMNMNVVSSIIRPWTDKDGNVRYYINNISTLISDYRAKTDSEVVSYYDFEEMHASGGRVRLIIEGNILSKTKVYVDSEGYVNIHGYAVAGKGAEMQIPELIVNAVNFAYGYCDESVRLENKKLIGKSGEYSRIGDHVKIVKGRKEVGKIFEVSKITRYSFNMYAEPSVYLYAEDGFKVSAKNCIIEDVGYSF